ncbi:MAG: hypothetical protein LBF26_02190 [Puniceicoccales bacterium]|jgi:hypothetical protein|nr:hypothetical protein [Puniceicoccales bacterium]
MSGKDMETMILTSANTVKDDDCGGWLKLVDYGEYQHRLGMQIVDASACKQMARRFSSLRQRLARRFRGVPIYIGHPDDPAFRGQVGHDDTRAYGWVKFIEARDDGLWVCPKWSRAGAELLENAYYKFLSPRWEMVPLGNERFTPKQLLSIGLTNTPNMDVEAIANQEGAGEETAEMARTEGAPAEDIPGEDVQTEDIPAEAITGDISTNDDPREPMPTGIDLPPVGLLRMPEQGAPVIANCARLPKNIINRQAITQSLDRRCRLSNEMRKQRVLTLVRERMEREHESFAAAWCNVKRTHPFWFEG